MTIDSRYTGYFFEFSLPNGDISAPDGIRRIRYIAVALSEKAAWELVRDKAPNIAGLKRKPIDTGPTVLEQARELGIPDGEARRCPFSSSQPWRTPHPLDMHAGVRGDLTARPAEAVGDRAGSRIGNWRRWGPARRSRTGAGRACAGR